MPFGPSILACVECFGSQRTPAAIRNLVYRLKYCRYLTTFLVFFTGVLKNFADSLVDYEQSEVLQYSAVYFFGPEADKVCAKSL